MLKGINPWEILICVSVCLPTCIGVELLIRWLT